MTSSSASPTLRERLSGPPPAWASSLRSPHLLGVLFGIGFVAGLFEFLLVFGIPPLGSTNGGSLALVVLLAALVGLALSTNNLRIRFFAVGLGVGLAGLFVGMYLSRMAFFAFS